jgi:hypothetical protein
MRLNIDPKMVEKVLSGVKKHQVVKDNAVVWRRGKAINFWNKTDWYRNRYVKSEHMGKGVCEDVLNIEIDPVSQYVKLNDSVMADAENLHIFANNEGFETWKEMAKYYDKKFKGKLVVWNYFKCEFVY